MATASQPWALPCPVGGYGMVPCHANPFMLVLVRHAVRPVHEPSMPLLHVQLGVGYMRHVHRTRPMPGRAAGAKRPRLRCPCPPVHMPWSAVGCCGTLPETAIEPTEHGIGPPCRAALLVPPARVVIIPGMVTANGGSPTGLNQLREVRYCCRASRLQRTAVHGRRRQPRTGRSKRTV